MIGPKHFADHVIEADLRQDTLYRIGPVESARVEGDDAVLQADLLLEKPAEPSLLTSPEYSREGSVYFRIRAYGKSVCRVLMSVEPRPFSDDSPMLAFHESMRPVPCTVDRENDEWHVRAGSTLVLTTGEGRFFAPSLFPRRASGARVQGGDLVDAPPFFRLVRAGGGCLSGVSWAIDPNEHFCGTGERFDRIDLYGRRIDLVNEDAVGVNSCRAYKNVPFLMSSRPYGLFMHSTAKMRLDIGCHSTQSLQWLVEDDGLDLFFIAGDDFREILHSYRRITGFPEMPPVWSFGAWMSRFTYWSDSEVTAVAERLRREEYPADVLHLDPAWFPEFWKCDFRFSPERFPDPEGFFQRMRDAGFRISLWQWPYIQEDTCLCPEAREKNYVGRVSDPASRLRRGLGVLDTLDLTRPEAVAWYKNLLRHALERGAAVIKADFGEWINEQAQYHGLEASKYRNLFALLYQQAVSEVTREVKGHGLIWARAAWAGSQRYPVHWGGDAAATYSGMAGTLRGGLHLGLSGFAFWSHDVGGFYGVPDFVRTRPSDDLYVRWTQMGVFSSHIRYHGTTPREPWEYPAVADSVREWLRLRYALLPYILSESEKSCAGGLPVLRALVLDWPDDPTAWVVSDQYLFGDAFLVCPVMTPSGTRDVYLPEGAWVDFWTGALLEGPRWLRGVESPLSTLPLYVRHGARVEFAEPVCCTDQLPEARRFTIAFDEEYAGFGASELARHVHLGEEVLPAPFSTQGDNLWQTTA